MLRGDCPYTPSLYLKNVEPDTTPEELVDFFSRYGNVTDAFVKYKPGCNVTYAFVNFPTVEEALDVFVTVKDKVPGFEISMGITNPKNQNERVPARAPLLPAMFKSMTRTLPTSARNVAAARERSNFQTEYYPESDEFEVPPRAPRTVPRYVKGYEEYNSTPSLASEYSHSPSVWEQRNSSHSLRSVQPHDYRKHYSHIPDRYPDDIPPAHHYHPNRFYREEQHPHLQSHFQECDLPYESELPVLTALLCTYCKQEGKFLCGNCDTPYCSQYCQSKDWNFHQKTCIVGKESMLESSKSASNELMNAANQSREAYSKSNFDDQDKSQHISRNDTVVNANYSIEANNDYSTLRKQTHQKNDKNQFTPGSQNRDRSKNQLTHGDWTRNAMAKEESSGHMSKTSQQSSKNYSRDRQDQNTSWNDHNVVEQNSNSKFLSQTELTVKEDNCHTSKNLQKSPRNFERGTRGQNASSWNDCVATENHNRNSKFPSQSEPSESSKNHSSSSFESKNFRNKKSYDNENMKPLNHKTGTTEKVATKHLGDRKHSKPGNDQTKPFMRKKTLDYGEKRTQKQDGDDEFWDDSENRSGKEIKTEALDKFNIPLQEQNQNKSNILMPEKIQGPIKQTMLFQSTAEKVVVCFMQSPSNFWVQRVKDSDTLLKINTQMFTFSKTKTTFMSPSIGDLCGGLYSDGNYYRAEIIKTLPDDMNQVYFIDYGNVCSIKSNNLCYLTSSLGNYPALAIQCSLSNISGSCGKEFTKEEVKYFKDIVEDKTLIAHVVKVTGTCHVVELVRDDGLDIASALRKQFLRVPAKKANELDVPVEGKEAESMISTIPTVIGLLKPEMTVSVMRVYEEAGVIWSHVVLESVCKDFTEMIVELQNSNEKDISLSVEEGDMASAFSLLDQQWYRSIVVKRKKESISVRYVDFGNEENVTVLRELALKHLQVVSPLLGFKVVIKDQLKKFEELMSKGEFQVAVKSLKENIVHVQTEYGGEVISLLGFPFSYSIKQPQCHDNHSETSSVTSNNVKKLSEKILTERKFEANAKTEVTVIWIKSAQEVYVHKNSDIVELNKLIEGINLYCRTGQTQKYEPVEGEVVCARYPADDLWYRSLVLKVFPGEKCRVLFIDYGNEEEISIKDTKQLDERFSLPMFSICVALSDVTSVSNFELTERLINKQFSLQVVDSNATPNQVVLFENGLKVFSSKIEPVKKPNAFGSHTRKKRQDLQVNVANFDDDRVKVIYIDPLKNFYIRLISQEKDFLQMQIDIQDFWRNKDKLPYVPEIDDVVCVQYDELWMRGYVISVQSDHCDVKLIDHGGTINAAITDIQPLPPRFFHPKFVISVCLEGVSETISEPLRHLCETVKQKTCVVKLIDKSCDPIKCKLFVDGQCLNEVLVKEESKDMSPKPVKIADVAKQKLSFCKQNSWPNGIIKVYFWFVEKDIYFLHKAEDCATAVQMAENLLEHCQNSPKYSILPCVGDAVCAKCSDDGLWYRALVEEVIPENNSCKVLFVDYGNGEFVSKNEICAISSELMSIPILATAVTVTNASTHRVVIGTEMSVMASGTIQNPVVAIVAIGESSSANEATNAMEAKPCNPCTQNEKTPNDCSSVGLTQKDALPKPLHAVSVENSKKEEIPAQKESESTMLTVPTVIDLLKPGMTVPVTPVYLEDGIIWGHVNLQNVITDFQKMTNELQIANGKEISSSDEGDIVCAYSLSEQQWYRGIVMKKEKNAVNVYYIDYGNKEDVTALRQLTLKHMQVVSPLLGFKVTVEDQLKKFHDVISKGEFKVTIESVVQNSLKVQTECAGEVISILSFPYSYTMKQPECRDNVTQPISAVSSDEEKLKLSKKVLTQRKLDANVKTPVTVVWVKSAQEIYVHKNSDLPIVEAYLLDINLYCKSGERLSFKPIVGEVIFARYPADDTWYRSLILEVLPNDKFVVLFIDYGNEEEISIEDTEPLDKSFLEPMFSICVTLVDVPTSLSSSELASRLIGKSFDLQVVDSKKSPNQVILFENGQKAFNSKHEPINKPKTLGYPVQKRQALKINFADFDGAEVKIIYFVPKMHFFIHILSQEKSLLTMQNEIEEFCQKNEKCPYVPEMDDVICVLHNKLWMRGYVVDIKSEKCVVKLIDHGSTIEAAVTHIRPLPPKFFHPAFSMSMCLDGVSEDKLSESLCESMKKIIYTIKITDKLSDPVKCKLYIDGECINDVLIMDEEKKADPESVNVESAPVPKLSFQKQSVWPNGIVQVYFWFMETDVYFLHKAEDCVTAMQMAENLLTHCQNSPKYSILPCIGDAICAKCSDDGLWYRALVEEVISENNSCKVLFVDYGNKECVSKDDMCTISSELMSIPILCFAVKVTNANTYPMAIGTEITVRASGTIENPVVTIMPATEEKTAVTEDTSVLVETVAEPASHDVMSNKCVLEAAVNTKQKFVLVDLDVVEFPIGPCYIMIWNSGGWNQLACSRYSDESIQALASVSSNIEEYCNRPDIPAYAAECDELVLAKSENDNVWYRALVTSKSDDKYEVMFIDFASSELIGAANVKQMTSNFMNLPIQIRLCCLGGFTLNTADETKLNAEVKRLPLSAPIEAVILEVKEDIIIIDIPSVTAHFK